MRLTPAEFAAVRAQGLFIREKCDGCGKLLNQSFWYTITGKPEVYCSAACRDQVFFGDQKHSSYRAKRALALRCQRKACGKRFESRRADAKYCSQKCQKWARRHGGV